VNSISIFIYFAAVAIALFCLLLIYLCRYHLRHFPRYLLAFIAVEVASLIFTLLLHTDSIGQTSLFLFLLSVTVFTSAPLVWMYAREYDESNPPPFSNLWPWQILSILVGIILCFPLLLLVNFGVGSHDYIHSGQFWRYYYISLSLAVGFYLLQVAINIIVSYRKLYHASRLTNLRSLIWPVHDDSPRRAALKIVLLGLSVHLLINILRALQCKLIGIPNLASLSLSFFDILITLALLLALLLIMLKETLLQLKSTQVGVFAKVVDKYQRSALGPKERARIRHKLETALSDHTLIHDNRLNLRRLADFIGEKPHYVSQVINQDLATNFFDLINSVRIRNALPQLLIADPPAIVDLAESLGFNSKSTFYTAFAKHMGMTPSQYRQNQSINN